MVKLKGPAISCGAHGSIADVMVFSENKGRQYVKKHTKPDNPKTASQVGTRQMIGFLSKYWNHLSTTAKTTWTDPAKTTNTTNYNAYLSLNLDRWARFLMPTASLPPRPTYAQAEMNDATANPLNRSIRLHLWRGEAFSNWGVRIHRSTSTGFTPAIPNTVALLPWTHQMNDDLYYNDGPLPPNTYYYRIQTFAYFGASDDDYPTQFQATLP